MPTHYQGTERERLALEAYIKVMRASLSLTDRLQDTLSKAGLTSGQFGVLEALHHLGSLCQRDLAAKLLVTAGNMTMLVRHLERDGLVRRRRNSADGRRLDVSMTARGRKLIEQVFPRHVARVVEEMSVLRPEEQVALAALCRRLGLGAGRVE
jgi:MarR family 2-MHQ and catechol resistance regulon transcriptional repressor